MGFINICILIVMIKQNFKKLISPRQCDEKNRLSREYRENVERMSRECRENVERINIFEFKLYSQAQRGVPQGQLVNKEPPFSGFQIIAFPLKPFSFDDLPKFNWHTVDGV